MKSNAGFIVTLLVMLIRGWSSEIKCWFYCNLVGHAGSGFKCWSNQHFRLGTWIGVYGTGSRVIDESHQLVIDTISGTIFELIVKPTIHDATMLHAI